MSKQMKDLQKYRIINTSLNGTIAIMRDTFGDNYLEWGDKTAENIYIDLLNVIEKVWKKERELKEKGKKLCRE